MIRKTLLASGLFLIAFVAVAQSTVERLQKAFQQFESDSQLKHAISSLYVIDAVTGQVVFDKNSQVGLAGASTQKIFTATTAFELLGKDFRYKTQLGFTGKIKDNHLKGLLFLACSGDPTLGSWRWQNTTDSAVLHELLDGLKQKKIKSLEGSLQIIAENQSTQGIPDGWIWQDIGNYYGAGAYGINWKENQFDMMLAAEDRVGGKVGINTNLGNSRFYNELKAAGKSTGDNAYIYYDRYVRGTIPQGENKFKISGAIIDTRAYLENDLRAALEKAGIDAEKLNDELTDERKIETGNMEILATHFSPALDSIVYWFLKKSINLYGEALIKTFAHEQQGFGSTDSGIAIVKKFWKERGLDDDELNIYDGSGLSPLNRLTTHAQVTVLKFAKSREWFPYFYTALPEYNGMKMKSGTISDVKGFCGYQKSKDGHEYIFSFLVNNYNGRTSGVVNKMYKVLDELK